MNKKVVVECVRMMISQCVRETSLTDEHRGEAYQVSVTTTDGVQRVLSGEGLEAFARCVDEINSDPVIGEKVSERKVEKSVWSLLLAFVNNPDAPAAEWDEVISSELAALREMPERRVMQMPISNLVFKDFTELLVGKVAFRTVAVMRERTIRVWESRLLPLNASAELRAKRE